MAAVTTLATATEVENALSLSAGTDSTIIGQILEDVTADISNHVGCPILYNAAVTDYICGDGGDMLFLNRWPVAAITSVTLADDHDYDNGQSLTEDTDYVADADFGILYYNCGIPWSVVPRSIKVVYKSGYYHPDDNTAGLSEVYDTIPDAIRGAAVAEAVARYNRRKKPELKSESHGDGSVTVFDNGKLIKPVVERLRPYRRPVI